MKHQTSKILSAIFFLMMGISVSIAQAQSPQQTLNQYISDLQKNPNDYALREKIIKHVQTMKPKPVIPEEAERYMARGAAAVKGAKTEKDFQDAAAEFEKASLTAPWLAAAYYNLGITQDKASKYKEAIQSLKFYLLAAPEASDAKAVKTLVYEIEYRQEKATKETSAEAIAERPRNKQEDFLRSLQGGVWVRETPDACQRLEITLTDDRLTGSCVWIKDCEYSRRGERCSAWDDYHHGRLAAARVNGFQIYGPNWKGEITPDGKIIKLYLPNWLTGQGTWETIYYRER